MEQLEVEYRLSLYESILQLNSSMKSEVSLVKNSLNDKVYIKKVLNTFNREVFERLKDIETIHIPRIYEILEWEEKLIIIEEYVSGYTLQQLMEEHGTLPESIVIRFMMSLCEVLAHLHHQDPPFIHRDLKPSNVMITNEGILKLIDFDVARIYNQNCVTDTHILGTKGYASPEQFGFEQTDVRSDIYSIGVMMNVLLTGKTPKECPVDTKLGSIIEKCTYFSPEKRYQNIGELHRDLKVLMKDYHISTTDFRRVRGKERHSFLNFINNELKQLPGYRGDFLIIQFIATVWYTILLIGAFYDSTASDVAGVGLIFAMTLLNGNYKNIWTKHFLLRKKLTVTLIVYNILIYISLAIVVS